MPPHWALPSLCRAGLVARLAFDAHTLLSAVPWLIWGIDFLIMLRTLVVAIPRFTPLLPILPLWWIAYVSHCRLARRWGLPHCFRLYTLITWRWLLLGADAPLTLAWRCWVCGGPARPVDFLTTAVHCLVAGCLCSSLTFWAGLAFFCLSLCAPGPLRWSCRLVGAHVGAYAAGARRPAAGPRAAPPLAALVRAARLHSGAFWPAPMGWPTSHTSRLHDLIGVEVSVRGLNALLHHDGLTGVVALIDGSTGRPVVLLDCDC